MKTAMADIENTVEKLLSVLDVDIQQIQENISRLNDLRGYVVCRNEESLRNLLAQIRLSSQNYSQNELRRSMLRKQLATMLTCSESEITLTKLQGYLSEDKKVLAAQRKSKLQVLSVELMQEHRSTTMLLKDCANFNSLLLRSILEVGREGSVTYSSSGQAQNQRNNAFMNLQF
ncbi:MAG: hypothetical protein K8R02_04565 [Anaerohalosphaeraceae bacterium]|nr:hypothetical protein [Anaerohalosphaeraceae bacterium]